MKLFGEARADNLWMQTVKDKIKEVLWPARYAKLRLFSSRKNTFELYPTQNGESYVFN